MRKYFNLFWGITFLTLGIILIPNISFAQNEIPIRFGLDSTGVNYFQFNYPFTINSINIEFLDNTKNLSGLNMYCNNLDYSENSFNPDMYDEKNNLSTSTIFIDNLNFYCEKGFYFEEVADGKENIQIFGISRAPNLENEYLYFFFDIIIIGGIALIIFYFTKRWKK